MNFNKLNEKIENNNLTLIPISEGDKAFINRMFNDPEIKKYYIVPKEARQDYRRLIDYWRNDVKNGAGNCWLINQKDNGLFSRNKQVGFIAFEFRDSLKNARISYAILPEYRKKGIATASIQIIIEKLKSEGVERIEADIDRDNLSSEKVVEKLSFEVNKRKGLVDPEMMRDGEIRMRALWFKELYDYSQLDFHLISEQEFNRLINNRTIFKIWEEENSEKYHFSLNTDVTESLVGISEDETTYNITWELLREESHTAKKFLILCGWGDSRTTGIPGGLPQFDYYEIGVEKGLFASLVVHLVSNNPDFFSIDKMSNVIGLEGFNFENGQIRI